MKKKKLLNRTLASVLSGVLVLSMASYAPASGPDEAQEAATEQTEADAPPGEARTEAQVTESLAEETGTPLPETQPPETFEPETTIPETVALETPTPEVSATVTPVPETPVPGTPVPETLPLEAEDPAWTQTTVPEIQEGFWDPQEAMTEPGTEAGTEPETEEDVEADVREWGLSGREGLWEAFDGLYRAYPESISSNAAAIEDFGPDKAIDDRLDTWWIPDTSMLDGDEVYLEAAFREPEMVKSIVFCAGFSDGDTYETPFSIYSSLSDEGEDFVKAGDGIFSTDYKWMEVQIEEQPFKRLRFSFPLSDTFMPVCCSIRFYTEAADDQVISGLPEPEETEQESPGTEWEGLPEEGTESAGTEAETEAEAETETETETDVSPEPGTEGETPVEEADVSLWPLYQQDAEMVKAYDKVYRIYPSGAPTTNYGTYPNRSLAGVIDDDDETFWEPYTQNNDTVKSWLDFTFPEPVRISRIVYGARPEAGQKGCISEFEIYASQTDEGDDFVKVVHGTYGAVTKDLLQIDFSERQFKRLRFKYIHSQGEYPSCRTMYFYKKDETEADASRLFTDYRMYELNEDYNTMDELNVLKAKLKQDPRYPLSYEKLIERAEKIINGELVYDPDLEVFASTSGQARGRKVFHQYGDVAGYARNTLKFSTSVTNRQPVGISAISRSKITVYVDGEKGDPLPSIVFSQAYGYWSSWLKNTTQLHLGANEITVPEFKVANANYSTKDIPSGGPVYIINPYTGSQQSSKVKLYFEGCDTYPYFVSGGDVASYKRELSAQADRAREDPTRYFDLTELVSNHVIHTVTATLADEMYDTLDPQANLNGWDKLIRAMLEFDGVQFDPKGDHYSPMNEHLNQNFRVSQNWDGGFMFTASEHIGLYAGSSGEDKLIYCLGPDGEPSVGWGFVHEYGHAIELAERAVVETTNNMPANLINTYYNHEIRNENYFDIAHSLASDRDPTHGYGNGAFNSNRYNYIIFFILESYFNGYWGRTDNLYRYGTAGSLTGTEKQVYLSSLATGTDLGYYFERWGYAMKEGETPFTVNGASAEYKALMQAAHADGKVTGSRKPFWYIDSAQYAWMRGNGNPATEKGQLYHGTEVPVIESVTSTSGGRSIRIKDGAGGNEAHLGYEILEGNGTPGHESQVIGFTYSSAFTDTADYAEGYVPSYTVIAYDRLLNKSAPSAPASPTAEGGVCEYDGQVYGSIGEAVEAAEDGGTVYIIKDTVDCGIVVRKNITVMPKGEDIILGRIGSEPLFTVSGAGAVLNLTSSEGCSLTVDGMDIQSASAVLCSKESGTLNLSGIAVIGANSTSDKGGAVCNIHPGRSNLNNVVFTDNKARYGGALYNTGTVSVTGCTFTGNTASVEGGAVDNTNGGVITLTQCRMEGNYAPLGGAFHGNGHTVMSGCLLSGNSAVKGGAVAFASANGARTFQAGSGTAFTGNKADSGNTAYLYSNGIAEFGDTAWPQEAGMAADTSAGAYGVYVDSGSLTLDGGHITAPLSLYKNKGSILIKTSMPGEGLLSLGLARYTTSEPLVRTNFQTQESDAGKLSLSDGDYTVSEGEDKMSLCLAPDYSVTLHTNGGTVNSGDVNGYIAGTYVLLPTDVTFEGRTFGGWYDNQGLKGTSVRSIKKTDAGDKEYWAKWNNTRYKITYNTNGGTIRQAYTSFYYSTDRFRLPTLVAKAKPKDKATVGDYAFEGWYANKELEGDPITEVGPGTASNLTVYAKWSHLAAPAVREDEEPAGCTEGSSYELVSYCVDCGALMGRERVYEDNPLGHTFGEWTVTAAPECEAEGVRSHSCTVCGFTETDGVSASGHDWEDQARVDRLPTCTADGSSSIHCRKCSATTANAVIPMLEHSPGAHVHENEIPATCTSDGGYDDVVRCTVCGAVVSSVHIPVSARGHRWGLWETTENATCHSEGAMKRVCLDCGLPQTKELSVASHEWEEAPRVDVAPTCTEDGSESVHCRVCGAQKDAKVLHATGHTPGTPVYENEVPPSCTADGSHTLAVYCEVCHQLVSKELVTVKAEGHQFGDWQVLSMPGCADEGAQIRYCSVCGVSETQGLSASGHDWEAVYTVDKEPTCTEPGSRSIHCRKCGAEEYGQEIPPLGHTPGTPAAENVTEAGCDTEGSYNEVTYCAECGTVVNRQTVQLEPAGHKFGEWKEILSPNCNDSGVKEHSCTICGFTETEHIDPLGHDWMEGFTVDKEPTCTEEGSESVHCRNCGAVRDSTVLHAKGHTPGEATAENRTEATCTADGSYDTVIRCVDCGGLIFHEKVVLEAEGHQFDEDGFCASCGEKRPEMGRWALPGAEPGTEGQTEADPQSETEGQTETDQQPETEGQTETDQQPETEGQTETDRQPETEDQTETDQPATEGQQETDQPATEGQTDPQWQETEGQPNPQEPELGEQAGSEKMPGTEELPGTEPGSEGQAERQPGTENQPQQPETEGQTDPGKQHEFGGQPGTDPYPGLGNGMETGHQQVTGNQAETGHQPETGDQTGTVWQPETGSQTVQHPETGSQMDTEKQAGDGRYPGTEVQEAPGKQADTEGKAETEISAKTSDDTPAPQLSMLMLASAALIAVLLLYRRKYE